MEAHVQWKYLINTDGQSASWRLAKLLSMDSPILKYRSDNIEYYYRCLAHCHCMTGGMYQNGLLLLLGCFRMFLRCTYRVCTNPQHGL